MVSPIHYSSGKDNWGTPPWLYSRCRKLWNFKLDACAEEWSAKCKRWYGVKDNGLEKPWLSWTWCNPPYSQIELWLEKAAAECMRGSSSVVLMPSRTDTRAFHRYAPLASKIILIKGRLKFIDPEVLVEKTSAPFPSLMLEFKSRPRADIKNVLPTVEFLLWQE